MLREIDSRAPIVRHSLKTNDLAKARAQRDVLEKADNQLWAAMLLDRKESPAAGETYRAAKLLSEAMGFGYQPADELARRPVQDIVQRVNAVMHTSTPPVVTAAVLGAEPAPKLKVSEAFDIYCDEIVADEISGKSLAQRERRRNVKQRAVNSFISVVEDKAMVVITRDDGRTIYKHWLGQVVPKAGGPRKSASMGNRMVGNMRVLYGAYFKRLGDPDRQNPFAGLTFAGKFKKTRPPFPLDWIKTEVLKPGALAGMNEEGRAIVLTLLENGRARERDLQPDRTIHQTRRTRAAYSDQAAARPRRSSRNQDDHIDSSCSSGRHGPSCDEEISERLSTLQGEGEQHVRYAQQILSGEQAVSNPQARDLFVSPLVRGPAQGSRHR
jgi:hypothetical protein